MRQICTSRSLVIPEDVTVTVKSRTVTVKGPRGSLVKVFKHASVDIYTEEKDGKTVFVVAQWYSQGKQRAVIRSIVSHVSNMVTGVRLGFQYKMRLVYAHFPINTAAEDKGTRVDIRNFLGERRVRQIKMLEGVTIKRDPDVKDQLLLEGNSIDNVSRSCALIHQACLVKKKDIRKFLDGIYVCAKGTVVQEEE
eukprot:CAMPEP_0119119572 /NCGR_PEP_ID=MMETSP1310-20130426/1006_1 /TAXON_ID=464262 /ORGANISM="Genus nov. species nov., Strain RCC2339" /LENGTH=193 /DNA_ID=CAMNT_0007109017 /DNA_START=13 /DNA_END=594 /DNA_ORIENTATION=-